MNSTGIRIRYPLLHLCKNERTADIWTRYAKHTFRAVDIALREQTHTL